MMTILAPFVSYCCRLFYVSRAFQLHVRFSFRSASDLSLVFENTKTRKDVSGWLSMLMN